MESGCDFCGYWKDGEQIIYTGEHLNWNGYQRCPSFSIDFPVTLPLMHLVERRSAFQLRCSRVYNNVRDDLANIPEDFHFYFCDEDEDD